MTISLASTRLRNGSGVAPRRVFARGCFTAALVFVWMAPSPESAAAEQIPPRTPIRAAVLTLDRIVDQDIVLTLVNTGHLPLEAWRWSIVFKTDTRQTSTSGRATDTYAWGYLNASPGPDDGPIPPGGRREIRHTLVTFREVVKTTLDVVILTDATWEGDGASAQQVFRDREAAATETDRWVSTLNEVLVKDTTTGRMHLLARLAETDTENASGTRQDLRRMMATVSKRADQDFMRVIGNVRDELVKRRTVALKHKVTR